ncbi:MAG: toll/interleukin-1 receptor domain-containing protein, partial [Actinomycetota bacterium]|nr:toll/interleukin-1 receptor domain-containing protein [Actinomycetota bacterium]
MGYDAFVSYSHAADGKLAPALQRGLERLARPWYRPRALAVFRDETGLVVSPHLWASIAHALDDSEWFVVLCSPEAAGSEWVEREIDYWLTHKTPDRILLVLTDGDLVWDRTRGDFDPRGSSALPPALFRKFSEEPRHLDLRWARGEEQLDLRHARFRPAVGELAAPIRNMAREELEAEDVRQHRRTVRLARGATSVVVLLLIIALTFGVIALQQRGDARHQAANARREADAARRAATGMLARGLAAEALNALHDGQPDLAQLLAVEAYRIEPSVYSRSSLLQAVVDQPALAVQLHGPTSGPSTIAISADGGLVAADGRLWDRRSGQPVARQPKDLGSDGLVFAGRGRLLLSASYSASGRLGIWDVARGRSLAPLPVSSSWAASADTSRLADLDVSGVLRVFDLETGKSLASIETGRSGSLAISGDGTTVAQVSSVAATPTQRAVIGVRAWTVATRREIGPGCSTTSAEAPASPSVLADDATVGFVTSGLTTAVAQPSSVLRCDLRTGGIASRAFAVHSDQPVVGISPDAGIAAVRSSGGTIQLNDTASGKTIGGPIDAPLTERMAFSTVVFSADGRWFTATGSGGDVRVWHTRPDLPLGTLLDLGSKFESRHDLHQTPDGRVIGVTRHGDVVDVDTNRSLGRI